MERMCLPGTFSSMKEARAFVTSGLQAPVLSTNQVMLSTRWFLSVRSARVYSRDGVTAQSAVPHRGCRYQYEPSMFYPLSFTPTI